MDVRSTSHSVYNIQVYKLEHSKSKQTSQYCQPNSVLPTTQDTNLHSYPSLCSWNFECGSLTWFFFRRNCDKVWIVLQPRFRTFCDLKRLCSQVLVSKFVLYRKLSLWLAGFSTSTPLANQIYSHSTNLWWRAAALVSRVLCIERKGRGERGCSSFVPSSLLPFTRKYRTVRLSSPWVSEDGLIISAQFNPIQFTLVT